MGKLFRPTDAQMARLQPFFPKSHGAVWVARIAVMISANQARRCASILRMMWPQAQSTAKRASPMLPFREHLARRRSVFKWPISASMALRRLRSAISSGVRPRQVQLIRTRILVSPCPR